MKTYPEERIGNPELFAGRKEELAFCLNWIDQIKEKFSKSTAILARRKMGKTALLERLYNITFDRQDGVIPFYYEVKEGKVWVVDFCCDFFLKFIFQYIAYKSRNPDYLAPGTRYDFKKARETAQKENLEFLVEFIEDVENLVVQDRVGNLWEAVRTTPHTIAVRREEFIVQIIDEFQFLNSEIYRDKTCTNVMDDLAGGYLSTAESKVAPLLVSGSWVGWLMNLLMRLLPARFKFVFLDSMPEDEALEAIQNYSRLMNIPVTEESVHALLKISEGSPFYISSLFKSYCPRKDLSTLEGLQRLLEFETLNDRGEIKGTWMEYVDTALHRVNDRYAKNIVLYLCKHRAREVTRAELLKTLDLPMTDAELEKKLKALVKADIMLQGTTNFDYRAVKDNIFDKVFRGVYQKEIQAFDPKEISREFHEMLEKSERERKQTLGKLNRLKGLYAEYTIGDCIRYRGIEQNKRLKKRIKNLPSDFNFAAYKRVWTYHLDQEQSNRISADILAVAEDPKDYSIIAEIKHRDTRKFNRKEVNALLERGKKIAEKEGIQKYILFIYSSKGLTKDASRYCDRRNIPYSDSEDWLEE